MTGEGRRLPVTVIIGTSGWQYRDWRGLFYPPKLPQRLWLEHYAGVLRHGREQQRLLPAARAGDVREVARAHPARLPVGGQGQPLPHPHQAAARAAGAGRPADGAGGRARGQARHDPAAAPAHPEGRRRPAARVPGPVPRRHPGRRRAAARELVDRRDPRAAGALRRGAVLGRPRGAAHRPAVAHHRLGATCGSTPAPGTGATGRRPSSCGRERLADTWAPGRGRPRLLQQRPGRGRDDRLRRLRRRRPPDRPDDDPGAHRRPGDRPGLGPGAEDAGAARPA